MVGMGGTSPVQDCDNPCAQGRADDIALANNARDLANGYQNGSVSRGGRTGRNCAQAAPGIVEAANRFDRYGEAIPSARAADDLNRLGDADQMEVTNPCLERLPLDPDALNRELGIPPGSPNAITANDLRNDTTGHRSAIYRSQTDGRLIMVSRDTQRHSLVDWKTNIENGQGISTDQYASTRRLANKLNNSGQAFDIAGYSKGGGLAQEAGLLSPNSNVYVFNSAGLHENSLARTGQANFNDLARRTRSFSAEGDFLTFMNETNDAAREIRNAEFLRSHISGDALMSPMTMRINYLNPDHAAIQGNGTPEAAAAEAAFQEARTDFLGIVDNMIRGARENPGFDRLFPPVRANQHETVLNSMSRRGQILGARNAEASVGKLDQHRMTNVIGPMENQLNRDRDALQSYLSRCGT
ncbi:MAG: hypothetical protein AAGK01_06400 [Pseudomonadota bacterium]